MIFPDKNRILEAKAGSKDALVCLIMNQKDQYYRLAYSYLGNRDDALDALQDMIVILYGQINRLRDILSFESWSKTILVNCCKAKLRQNRKTVSLEDVINHVELEYVASTPSQDPDMKKNDILRAVMRLSPAMQEVIRLRYFLDLDYQTIAGIAGIPVGTVKSRLSAAVKHLKQILGGDYFED